MRSHLRALTTSALLALTVLAIAASAVFADGGGTRHESSYEDAWCFQDVVLRHCFEDEGTSTTIVYPNGTSEIKSVDRSHTTTYDGDDVVGEAWVVTKEESV